MPLALTDDELSTVMRYGGVLHPHDRKAYLEKVSRLLQGQLVGPGSLHRACEQAQLELRSSVRPADVLDGSSSLAPERGRSMNGGKYA